MLALIGLGISGDLTLRGKELAEKADEVYAEMHTGVLQNEWIRRMEELLGKSITILEREKLEAIDDDLQLASLLAGLLVVPLVELEPALDEQRVALVRLLAGGVNI